MNKEKGTTPLTWIVTIVVFILCFYISSCWINNLVPFQSKSDRCKDEAHEKAASLRDSELRKLELKEEPTEGDLAEIDELKRMQEAGLASRDDYDYLYNDCMR